LLFVIIIIHAFRFSEVEGAWMNFDVLLLYLLLALCYSQQANGILSISLDSKHVHNEHHSLKAIKYCKDCPSAEVQGSMGTMICMRLFICSSFNVVYGLEAKFGVKEYHVSGGDIF
jgi:hypothetical protein